MVNQKYFLADLIIRSGAIVGQQINYKSKRMEPYTIIINNRETHFPSNNNEN